MLLPLCVCVCVCAYVYVCAWIQGAYNQTQIHTMHQFNPKFKPVKYINSHTSPGLDVEHTPGGRMSVLYYCTGQLAEAIDDSQTMLKVR